MKKKEKRKRKKKQWNKIFTWSDIYIKKVFWNLNLVK